MLTRIWPRSSGNWNLCCPAVPGQGNWLHLWGMKGETPMPKDMMKTLARKLHPRNFAAMSPMMTAIVACILGQKWTEPRLAALMVTSDGFVLGQNEGDVGFNAFIGPETDLRRNWSTLLVATQLRPAEKKAADEAFQAACQT